MSSSLIIRASDCEGAPRLERPLNDVLQAVELRLRAAEAAVRSFVVPNVNITTGAAVALGTAPFPLRLGLPMGFSVAGLCIIRAENLTTAGAVATAAHAINSWRQDGSFLIVDFVTGLATNTSYRFTLGGFRA